MIQYCDLQENSEWPSEWERGYRLAWFYYLTHIFSVTDETLDADKNYLNQQHYTFLWHSGLSNLLIINKVWHRALHMDDANQSYVWLIPDESWKIFDT